MTKIKVVRYEKQAPHVRPIKHAVANFLDTIKPVCNEYPEQLFPTIFPDALAGRCRAQADFRAWIWTTTVDWYRAWCRQITPA